MKDHRMLKPVLFSVIALSLAATLSAQAVKTGPTTSIQVGFGFTAANPDYSNAAIKGFSIFANYDVGKHFGLTGEINEVRFGTPKDIGEASYLYGARYKLNHGIFHPYAKGLFGLGSFQYQKGTYANPTTLHFAVYAIGGGLDIQATRHLSIRAADIEYQFEPQFTPHGLNPFQGTTGVAYRF
jgi:hypothetical protein